ncbi:U32 family peptidase [Candidatus Bathyarchaeota archaeon]|nr:U32 family peptidase [Candidatus Bathyarchaeota archaeon]
MELMAPVGSKDAFKAAMMAGADANYLGAKLFGARRLAENFTEAELGTAIRLAHKNGVKAYVTVNTLIKEKELQAVFTYLDYLESIDCDAVIIQDRGLLRVLRENFSLPIHASTQMGIHSVPGVLWAEKNDIQRVILSRELHLNELEEIRNATKLELEVFIHGSLCYSFSGQCLFASSLEGRSGNRGLCTQPCRKQYRLKQNTGFLLSSSDIYGIEALPDLLRIGIDALKIEGRMRSPSYVYLTSKVYKEAIKRAHNGERPLITDREKELLDVVFNRGYGRGYILEKNVMHREYAGSRGLFLADVDFVRDRGLINPNLVKAHDGITLYKRGQKIGGFEIIETENNCESLILQSPFTLPDGRYQVYKTKDREFEAILKKIKEMEFPTESQKRRDTRSLSFETNKRGKTKGELSFYVSSLKSLEKIIPFADRVYFEWNNNFEEASRICSEAGIESVLMLPRLSFNSINVDAENIMICSIDQLEQNCRRIFGHHSMNFFNSFTIPELYQYALSPELSREDIKDIAGHFKGRLEAMVFGRIELMISRDDSLGEGTLVDEKGIGFPVQRDRFGFTHILNSSDLFLLDYLNDLEDMGIDSFGVDLRRREPELSRIVAKAFYERDLTEKATIKKLCRSITARNYLRGVV